ncbi:TerC family protein [Pseudonocardia sp. TMWB2A]|uniref:TerC family protein n=1 Tax=Pseudonocardia sp. TMWB2A TaxID=687430 RepID=UPI00307E3998
MIEQWLALAAGAASAAPSFGSPAEIWQHIVNDFANITEPSNFWTFLTVIGLDLLLAADNAIIVGALAAGLPAEQRRKVIILGVVAALILRIIFALIAVQLMNIVGLIFVGGLLLLWVGWKMWREMRDQHGESPGSPEIEGDEDSGLKPAKSFWAAAWAVGVADVSMSLDNVLAVAGAAKDHPGIMIVGLVFAVALMGVAANFLARLIERYKWVGYVGLLLVLYVAIKMMHQGWVDPAIGLGTLFS